MLSFRFEPDVRSKRLAAAGWLTFLFFFPEMKSNTGAHLGSCNKADQNPALCQAEILGGAQFTFGAVTDLLFCDLDNVPQFCDPAS
jgi:hypothetical protein